MTTYNVPSISASSPAVSLVGVSATTLQPGASATVINTGTETAANLVFGIPAGATGPAGGGSASYTVSAQTILPNGPVILFPIGSTGTLNAMIQVSLNVTVNGSTGTIATSFTAVANSATRYNISGTLSAASFQGVSLALPVSVVSGNLVIATTGSTGFTVNSGTVTLFGTND